MVFDLELVENAYGPDEGFTMTLLDENGDPDNLLLYTTIKLVISDMQYTSPPTRNHTDSDAELAVDTQGHVKYIPTATNKVPTFGRYYGQIFRIDTPGAAQKPALKFSILVTREVPQV